MPPREWKIRVEDIVEAARRIQQHTAGMDRDAFTRDAKTADAVQYQFVVIGEAARHVPDDITGRHLEIPWAEMRDMRNVVAHGYFRVSLDIMWETATRDVPPLIESLRRLLDEE